MVSSISVSEEKKPHTISSYIFLLWMRKALWNVESLNYSVFYINWSIKYHTISLISPNLNPSTSNCNDVVDKLARVTKNLKISLWSRWTRFLFWVTGVTFWNNHRSNGQWRRFFVGILPAEEKICKVTNSFLSPLDCMISLETLILMICNLIVPNVVSQSY